MSTRVTEGIEVKLPITCMIEAHGLLIGYATADGKIAVKACEYCENVARQAGADAQDVQWRKRIAEAVG